MSEWSGQDSVSALISQPKKHETWQKIHTDSEDGQQILALARGGIPLLSGQAGLKEKMGRLTNKRIFVEEATFLRQGSIRLNCA